MKIYVAGRSKDVLLVAGMIQNIEEMGHTITHDWTREVLKHQWKYPGDVGLPREIALQCAQQNVIGVYESYILIYYHTGPSSPGQAFELGLAYARDEQEIWWVGDTDGVFYTLADKVLTYEQALIELRALA